MSRRNTGWKLWLLATLLVAICPSILLGQTTRYWRQTSPGDINNTNNWSTTGPLGQAGGTFGSADIFLVTGSNPTTFGTNFSQSQNLQLNQFVFQGQSSSMLSQNNRTLTFSGSNARLSASAWTYPDGKYFTLYGGIINLAGNTDFEATGSILSGNRLSISSQVLGQGSLRATGGANVYLWNTNNNYTGDTRIDTMTRLTAVSIANSGQSSSLGSGNNIVFEGVAGTLYAQEGGLTNRTIRIAGSNTGVIDIAHQKVLTLTGNLAVDSGAILAKTGTGTLIINSSPQTQLHGKLSLSQGSTTVWGSNTLAAAKMEIFNGAVLTLGSPNSVHAFRELGGSGIGYLNMGSGSGSSLTVDQATNTTFGGQITGDGSFTKSGSGTLNLTMNRSSQLNSWAGSTRVFGGTLSGDMLGNIGMAGSFGTAANAVGSSFVLQSGGVLSYTGANTSTNRTVALNNFGGGVSVTQGSAELNWNGTISGTGGLTKHGAGTLLLTGQNTYTGTTLVNEGTLKLGAGERISNSSALVVADNGTFHMNGFQETVGSLAGGGTVLMGNVGILRMGQDGSSTTFSGTISGNGLVIKQGAGTFTLSGSIAHAGLGIEQGTLSLTGSERLADLGSVTMGAFSTLNLNGHSETIGSLLGSGTILLGSGNLTVGGNHSNTSFSGNIDGAAGSQFTKTGTGTMTISGQNTLAGTVQVEDGQLQLTASGAFDQASLVNVTSTGTLKITGSQQILSVVNSDGTVALDNNSAASVNQLTNAGQLALKDNSGLYASAVQNASGGTLTIEGNSVLFTNSLQNDAGASITLTSGAQLAAVTLVNDGIIDGDLSLSAGQLMSGNGFVYGMTSVSDGGTLAPGNSIGVLNLADVSWGSGGRYEWEVSDTLGGSGSTWDFLDLSGTLTISATDLSPFAIDLVSLGGPIANFDPTQNYSWSLLTAAGGILGFDPSRFLVSTTGFQNSFAGTFSLSQNGNSLQLHYGTAAVPEPSSLMLFAIGVGIVRLRNRKNVGHEHRPGTQVRPCAKS
ncbi:MAG: autotransporter-associated beta strand repeat-containing protein [Fuerstiella sp.]